MIANYTIAAFTAKGKLMMFVIINSLVALFFVFLIYFGLKLKIQALIPINTAGFAVAAIAVIFELSGFESRITTLVIMIIILSLLILDFLISFRGFPESVLPASRSRKNEDMNSEHILKISETCKIVSRESVFSEELERRNGYSEEIKIHALDAWKRGNTLYGECKYLEALKQYRISENHIPTSVVFLNRSSVLIQLGEFERAFESSKKALKLNPDFYEAWINQSIALEKSRKLNAALDCLNSAQRCQPDTDEVWFLMGNLLMKQHKYPDAIKCYETALNISPTNLEAWYNKGLCLNKTENAAEAFQCFERVVSLNPAHYQALYNRGNTLTRLNRNEEAILSYEKAIKMKPDYSEAYNNRGISLYKLGRTREALKSYEKALKLKSDAFEAWINQALLFDNLGYIEKAIYSYQHFIEYAPDEMSQHIEMTQKRIEVLQKSLVQEKLFLDPVREKELHQAAPKNLKPSENMA
ncbi:tetratricopeptide repeat protein [candidate division KSB1 bacterium]|nr:tetratricopeptide repeat protein [candidate division KSB1 bacterium]